MTAPKTALILVDVINSFFLEGQPNFYPAALDVLGPLHDLLAAARAGGHVVVHAVEQHYPEFDDYEFKKLPRHHMEGAIDAAFFGVFHPEGPREIVTRKRRFSAFFATDLDLTLRENAIERLVVAGVKTNVCVRATIQDGFGLGYSCLLAREATNSNRTNLEAAAVEDIDRYMGWSVALADAEAALG